MSDDLFDRFAVAAQQRNPVRAVQREMRRPLPKRFYQEARAAAVADGSFALTLDGKAARTPRQHALVMPTRAAGDAIAAEWSAQATHIDPAAMPMTRLVNSALDGVAGQIAEVQAEIVKYAESDLICYRAAEPDALATLEAQAWDPVLAWARDALGASLIVGTGIAFAEQPPAAMAAIADQVGKVRQPIRLACLHTMTTLSGSALMALAVTHGRLAAPTAWAAAHVDEDFQMRLWGEDTDAMKRRAARWCEMEAAAQLFAMLG